MDFQLCLLPVCKIHVQNVHQCTLKFWFDTPCIKNVRHFVHVKKVRTFCAQYQNLIKTKLRNLLSIETLNYHLQISLNGCEHYSSFDYNEAYNYWNNVPQYNNRN